MSIKGFTNQKKQGENNYVTLVPVGSDRFAIDMSPKYVFQVGAIRTCGASTATPVAGVQTIHLVGHGAKVGDILSWVTPAADTYWESVVVEVTDANFFVIQNIPDEVPESGDTFYLMRPRTPTVDSSGNIQVVQAYLTVIDEIDTLAGGVPGVLNTDLHTIPKRSNPPLQIVAALASACKKIQVISDVGAFIELYTDAAGTVKIATLPLTPDETIEISISAGTSLYIRNAKDEDITGTGSLMLMNILG